MTTTSGGRLRGGGTCTHLALAFAADARLLARARHARQGSQTRSQLAVSACSLQLSRRICEEAHRASKEAAHLRWKPLSARLSLALPCCWASLNDRLSAMCVRSQWPSAHIARSTAASGLSEIDLDSSPTSCALVLSLRCELARCTKDGTEQSCRERRPVVQHRPGRA